MSPSYSHTQQKDNDGQRQESARDHTHPRFYSLFRSPPHAHAQRISNTSKRQFRKVGEMKKVVSLSLLVLLSLVEIHCHQTFPYVSFMGQTLANHSYVDISQVGTDGDTVQCHTELTTCCSSTQGPHRGNWYFPNGTILRFESSKGDIVRSREAQKLELHRRNNANEPTGMYHCDIPVSDDDKSDTVYVGLYTSVEGI